MKNVIPTDRNTPQESSSDHSINIGPSNSFHITHPTHPNQHSELHDDQSHNQTMEIDPPFLNIHSSEYMPTQEHAIDTSSEHMKSFLTLPDAINLTIPNIYEAMFHFPELIQVCWSFLPLHDLLPLLSINHQWYEAIDQYLQSGLILGNIPEISRLFTQTIRLHAGIESSTHYYRHITDHFPPLTPSPHTLQPLPIVSSFDEYYQIFPYRDDHVPPYTLSSLHYVQFLWRYCNPSLIEHYHVQPDPIETISSGYHICVVLPIISNGLRRNYAIHGYIQFS